MQPTVGQSYRFRDVNGIEATGICIGRSEYQDGNGGLWEFAVALPHDEDAGRGAVLNAREEAINEVF
jgi:hypothetical protein